MLSLAYLTVRACNLYDHVQDVPNFFENFQPPVSQIYLILNSAGFESQASED